MKTGVYLWFVLVIACAPSQAQSSSDNQQWTDVQLAVPVTKDVDFNILGGLRLGRDWSVDRWVRNRFSVGATKVFNKHYTQEFYYLRQNDGVSVPGDLNVIGTTLRFKL